MSSLIDKLRRRRRRSAREARLDEELQFHLQEEAELRRDDGASEDDAQWAARRDLGNIAQLKEDTREVWGWMRWEQFVRDVGCGLRQVRRNPGFSAIAIATLALGVGGITAMFSIVDAVLIRPLPYAHADRLVVIWDDQHKLGDLAKLGPTPAEWLEWRQHNTVLTDVAATEAVLATLSGDSEPEQVQARKVTGNFWSVLGVKPLKGRVFTEEDKMNMHVAVISFGLWQRRYGASADAVGRKLIINDTGYEVVGVMPREFYFLPARDIDIWVPASFPPGMLRSFGWHAEQIVGRLKPGVTLQQAQQAMAALSEQITAARDSTGPHPVVVTPLREELAGKTQTALVLLLCASAALLLIACVNLANLLLSRGITRSREIAVRVAIGASRSRLLAQLLTESFVLAGLGAGAGLLLAAPTMHLLEALVPETMTTHLALDWRVLAFSAFAAITATLIFGLVPAIRESQLNPQSGLRECGHGRTGFRSYWFRNSLVVVETALAVGLLMGGGLLFQTLQHLRNTDLGLRSGRLLTLEIPLGRYRDFDRRVADVNEVLDRIRAIPGVVSAAATSQLPLQVNNASATFYLFAGQSNHDAIKQIALIRSVSRDYFQTVGARLREGRLFDASDRKSDSPVAIVNESFASRNFPGRSAIGAKFQFGQLGDKGRWYTIVGVIREIREVGMAEELRPTVYRVHEQTDQISINAGNLVIRTSVKPESIVSATRQAIRGIDRDEPIWHVQTFDEIIDRQLSTPSRSTTLLTVFALLALTLTCLGLYGVLSYAVTQRTNEIGIRMALGGTPGRILASFGGSGFTLTLAGLVIGLLITVFSSRLMTSLLYGFRPDYLPAITIVAIVLIVVSAAACSIPAYRASRIDPAIALRNE